MTQFILMSLMMIVSIMFMNMKHPLAMGLTLLIQTIIMTLISGLINKTYWFSYILFLVFVGGMLVLFIYVTSLASNEMFAMPSKNLLIICTTITFTFIMMLLIDQGMIFSFIENNEMKSITYNQSYNLENQLDLNKLYSNPTNLITTMLILYLLISLIAIVKITNLFYGPLRPMQKN
uniref:NADH-ubiquinone oxidoreductase chain 6 n=1 Tax=Geron pallipilosus TaxID=2682726 RepID=A0A6B9PJG9_9MUSC|nr:NADH dehydrogenase subunit 6 [Geron pallipilosus]